MRGLSTPVGGTEEEAPPYFGGLDLGSLEGLLRGFAKFSEVLRAWELVFFGFEENQILVGFKEVRL